MNAVISGRSGRALILDGESLQSFDLDDPANIVPRDPSELPYLFGEAKDLRILEDTTVESVAEELERERHFTWALDLTLISLDSELEDDIRTEALEALEELFGDGTVIERVENVLYSAPLPADADLMKALELCDLRLGVVRTFLESLAAHQSEISVVVEAIESILINQSSNVETQKQLRYLAVHEGLFRTLVKPGSSQSVSVFLSKAEMHPAIQQLPNYLQVLQNLLDLWYVRSIGTQPPAHTVSLDALLSDKVEECQFVDPKPDPALLAEIAEQKANYLRSLQDALANLSKRDQSLLILHLDGWTNQEIANAWGENVVLITYQITALKARISDRVKQKRKFNR